PTGLQVVPDTTFFRSQDRSRMLAKGRYLVRCCRQVREQADLPTTCVVDDPAPAGIASQGARIGRTQTRPGKTEPPADRTCDCRVDRKSTRLNSSHGNN